MAAATKHEAKTVQEETLVRSKPGQYARSPEFGLWPLTKVPMINVWQLRTLDVPQPTASTHRNARDCPSLLIRLNQKWHVSTNFSTACQNHLILTSVPPLWSFFFVQTDERRCFYRRSLLGKAPQSTVKSYGLQTVLKQKTGASWFQRG
jgi:hypothetical protein